MKEYNIKETIFDFGLRQYLFYVYKYMTLSLLVTTLSSIFTSMSPKIMYIIHVSWFKWFFVFIPFIMAAMINKLLKKPLILSKIFLVCFSIVLGLSISSVFVSFTAESMSSIFLVTTLTLSVMSLYGYYTKRDLSNLYAFLIVFSTSTFIAAIINLIFLKSNIVFFSTSILGTVIFVIFIAHDTQKIKALYYNHKIPKKRLAIHGALVLYINFINLFIYILQLFGTRKDSNKGY